MDSDEVVDGRPRRRRRRRHRHRSEEAAPPAERLRLGPIFRQLAGLGVFGLLFLLVAAAPIPMGANRDWAWSPMVIVIGILALLCAVGAGGREGFKILAAESAPLLVLITCFLAFMTVALLQMSTLVSFSPSAALFAKAGELLGQVLAPVPSLAVDESRDALLKCIGCAALFMIARVLFHDRQWSRLLLVVFVVSGVIVMTYAVYMAVATHSCYVGSYLKKQGDFNFANDRCLASGTFVGSNNFGCFMGMALVAAVGLMFDDKSSRAGRQEREYGSEANPIAEWMTGWRITMVALSLYFLGGLMLSASRAGAASTVAGVVALVYLMLRGRSGAMLKWAAIGGTLVGILVLVIAGGAFLHKVSLLSESANLNRVVIWQTSIEALLDSPWLGWGLGAYNDIYASYQSPTITQPNDKAHSTALEFLVEMGFVGGLPALAVGVIPWGVCLIGALRRRRRHLAAVAFSVTAVPILHSTVDFSLQMPAIGFVVSVLFGMGWAHSFSSDERPQRSFAREG
jgi:O-antigen ligase